jgi:hypothetical protein
MRKNKSFTFQSGSYHKSLTYMARIGIVIATQLPRFRHELGMGLASSTLENPNAWYICKFIEGSGVMETLLSRAGGTAFGTIHLL